MAELIERTCPNCGGKMKVVGHADQLVCPYCGTEFFVPREEPMAPPPVGEPLRCPKCGKVDRVQKASSVYSAGLSDAWGEIWHLQTELSRLLSPPVKPSSTDWEAILIRAPLAMFTTSVGGLLTCCGLTLLIAALSANANDISSLFNVEWFSALALTIGILSLGLFLVALTFWLLRKGASEHRRQFLREKARWREAMHRWERLYYCGRDDGVFVPGATSLIPISQIETYLYPD